MELSQKFRNLRTAALLAGGVSVAAFGFAVFWLSTAQHERQSLLVDAEFAFKMQDFAKAADLCERYLQQRPDGSEALLLAARSAMALGRAPAALSYFQRLLADPRQETELIAHAIAGLELEQRRARAAERWFRRALKKKPDFLPSQQRLAYLLDLQGRRHESLPLRIEALKRGAASEQDLFVIGHPSAVLRSPELGRLIDAAPDNLLLRLPAALDEAERGSPVAAEQLLQQIVRQDPRQLDAQAALGNLLLGRTAAQSELLAWHQALPASAGQHAGIWVVWGLWAQQLDARLEAARCFWEALRLDPNNRLACLQLSQSLAGESDRGAARHLAARAEKLQQFVEAVDEFAKAGSRGDQLRRIAELAEELGRLPEAHGWYKLSADQWPQAAWASAGLTRTAAQLSSNFRLVTRQADPIAGLALDSLPLPDFAAAAGLASQSPPELPQVVFRDVAAEAGIDFRYFNSEDRSTPGRLMFEFTGGGVAVLDFDLDGWPDLYFTQGCRWPPHSAEDLHRDRLFRNLGDGTFGDVTTRAGLGDNRYSQGVAVGDFDNDGFPDLLVANIGANRLYHNQGDGTFRDVTEAAGLSGERWTTSCLIADLNGDAWPDIYEVNYVEGDDVFQRRCPRGDTMRICQPTDFAGQPDRFFLGLGDGRFADRTAEAGIVADRGGLGVLAADFDGSGQLSVFVANDMTNNFFFVNSRPRGAPPRFNDEAMLAGLAFDRNGHAQACMGIAAGDADGDGRVDLFVTNFSREANTLYRSVSPGQFVDDSHRTGLAAPSLPWLGFGTQFLDAELDGRLDLVVTNGHIDDLTDEGIAHEMPPQFFRNLGGTFVELKAEHLASDYFHRSMLGRGLAVIDFNRDGREDFAVTHLDLPAALLANETPTHSNFLTVRLAGTKGARDAHGAAVKAMTRNGQVTRQLTAGSGYHASNQKQLVLGLNDATRVELEVLWPSGLRQQFPDLATNQQLLIVEGQDEVYSLTAD